MVLAPEQTCSLVISLSQIVDARLFTKWCSDSQRHFSSQKEVHFQLQGLPDRDIDACEGICLTAEVAAGSGWRGVARYSKGVEPRLLMWKAWCSNPNS